jgi:hypothetical protein
MSANDTRRLHRGELVTEAGDLGEVGEALADALPSNPGSGESSGLTPVRVPFAFDDADLLTGKTIYTPTAGDLIVMAGTCISITTAFDGTTPVLDFGPAATPWATGLDATTTDSADTPVTGLTAAAFGSTDLAGIAGAAGLSLSYRLSTDPLVLTLSDGSSGDPESAQGAGEVVLLVIPA